MGQDRSSFWQKISGFAKDRDDEQFKNSAQSTGPRGSSSTFDALDVQRKKDYFIRCQELRALRRLMQQKSWAESDENSSRHTVPASALSRAETLKRITEIEATFNSGAAVKRTPTKAADGPSAEMFRDSAPDADPKSQEPSSPEKDPQAAPVLTEKVKPQRPPASRSITEGSVQINQPGQQVQAKPHMFATTQVITMGSDIQYIRNPVVDEAAAAYAKGDNVKAVKTLELALAPGSKYEKDAETWKAYFDLLRILSDASSFSKAAKQYVALTSAPFPRWNNRPRLLPTAPEKGFVCPARLGSEAATNLSNMLSLASESKGIDLNFKALRYISSSAFPILHMALNTFANFAGELRLTAGDNLLDILAEATPPGDKEIDILRWETRLMALRMLQRESDYEFVGLDFAATYRVTPPPYKAFRLRLKNVVTPTTSHTAGNMGLMLSGVITGSRNEFLAPLAAAEKIQGRVEVSLREVERMEYQCANALRDWSRAQASQGKEVSFTEVNRIIAVLLSVVGINSYAQIRLSEP